MAENWGLRPTPSEEVNNNCRSELASGSSSPRWPQPLLTAPGQPQETIVQLSHSQTPEKLRDTRCFGGFPGGSVVKNLPASAGDTGLIPSRGRSHVPQGSWASVPQLLSVCPECQPRSPDYWSLRCNSSSPATTREKPTQQPRPVRAESK